MKTATAIWVAAVTAVTAVGQQMETNTTVLRQRLATIDVQLGQVREAARQSSDVQAKRIALAQAEMAYSKAVSGVPGLGDLDKQITAVRAQLRDLMGRREQMLKSGSTEMATAYSAHERAAAEFRQAAMGGKEGERLLADRLEVARALSTVERNVASSAQGSDAVYGGGEVVSGGK